MNKCEVELTLKIPDIIEEDLMGKKKLIQEKTRLEKEHSDLCKTLAEQFSAYLKMPTPSDQEIQESGSASEKLLCKMSASIELKKLSDQIEAKKLQFIKVANDLR